MTVDSNVWGTAWILAAALAAVIPGYRAVWRIIRDLRAPASTEQALLWWDERPVPAFRQDPAIASFMAVHSSAVVAISILAVVHGLRAVNAPPAWMPAARGAWSGLDAIWLVYYGCVGLSTWLAWFVAGSELGLPAARRRWSPVRMVLAEEGVYYGQAGMPWGTFGRARRDGEGGLIRLYSARSPELVIVVLRPPTPELLHGAQRIIEERVPPLPENDRAPWYRRKLVFGLLLVMTALPVVAVGLAAYRSTAPWTWASQSLGALLATFLGSRIVQAYR